MISRTDYGAVSQFIMGKAINGQVLYSMAVYLLGNILIDTGPFAITTEARDLFASLPISLVINTHHHEDHIGNNYSFNERGIPIYAHSLAVPLIEQPASWTYCLRPYQKLVWEVPPASSCWAAGEYVEFGPYRLKLIHTPGHSLDHVCLLEEERGWLFAGDVFLGEKVKMLRADENVHQSINSLNHLLRYKFDTIFCSSGKVFDQAHTRLQNKLEWWQQLYNQIVALDASGCSAEDIRDQLLGQENAIAQATEGNISKLNLVKAFLAPL